MDKILEFEYRKRRLFLDQAAAVIFGALLRVPEHLVCAPEKKEGLGIPGPRVIRMKSSRHNSINPMNGLDVRVAANLQDFIIIIVGFHVFASVTACTRVARLRKSGRYRGAVRNVTVLLADFEAG
jgi:hypothetical protein